VMPRLVTDGSGGVVVVWRDFRADTAGDLYAQHLNPDGTSLWTATGVPVTTIPLVHPRDFAATSDGAGGAIIVWQDDRVAPGTNDIYAQRLDRWGGVKWPVDGIRVCATAGSRAAPHLDADGAGGAVITWQDYRSHTNVEALAQRVDSTGAALWTLDGVSLCTAISGQYSIAVAADGTGGAAFAWEDTRTQNTWLQIFAQRVDAGGTIQWSSDGIGLSGTAQPYYAPLALSDGVGGAIVQWFTYNGGINRLFAQRLNPAGVSQWSTGGVFVGLGIDGGGWYGIAAVSDGAGGLISAWLADNGSGFEIRAQRISADGSAMWDPPGVVLCTAPNLRLGTTLVADGEHGAIAGWMDLRNGTDYDLYAEHVGAAGTLDAPPFVPVGRFLAPPSPSPSSAGESVTFRLQMPGPGAARLEILDAAGRSVRNLAARAGAAGPIELRWDGRDASGHASPPGLYFARAQAAGHTAAAKLVVLQ
jgi:flagellar hook capping protein FlgD